jgi:ribosomal protein L31
LIPGATTTISTTTGFSTTTIPGSGFFLIGNATSGYSAISNAIAVVYATTNVNLIDNYLLNGALVLRDDTGTLIDETPASSTAAWPGGAPGPATSTMARNFGIGQGASTTSWHTAIIATNFDAGILDKGTPGSYNGYSVSGQLAQLNGDATGTIYILARQFGTTTATATANFATTGAYSMHLFEALYDFFGFRNSTGTGASYDTGEEPIQTLNNNGLGYQATSSGTSGVNFDLALDPSITGVTPSSANIGDTITIAGRYFGNSTSTAQGNVYIPQNILATDRVTSWSSTSIQVVIPPTTSAPGPQTGTLQLKIGWTPTTTASLTIKPKIATSTTANENSVIINFDSYMNGGPAGTASNYTLLANGTPVSLSGAWTEFRGNRVYIKGISLTAGNTFSITANSNLTSVSNTPIDASFNNATGTVAAAPRITSISPGSGTAGATTTIIGVNFGAATATGTVYFSPGPPTGGQPPQLIQASIASWSATQIVAVVPSGAKSGPISINTASGLESDFSPSSFFDVLVNLNFKVQIPNGNTLSTSTARIIIGKMGGPTLYYAGDGTTLTSGTANNATITIPSVSSVGFNWAFDSDGTYSASRGQEVNSATTTVFNLATSTTKISGVISGATANGTLVVFADPVEGSGSQMEFKEPVFVKTNANGTTSYSTGLSATGTYIIGVEDPGFGGTASSSPKLAPAVRTVNASTTTAISGVNFAFTEAQARIHGKLEKATGGFTVGPGTDAFRVWAYQPVENGLHASAMIDASGEFDLYVNPGVYLIEAGGPFIPFAVKEQIEVKAGDANFATSNAAIDITLVIKVPTEYIAGQVSDSAGNGVSGASIFAWLTTGFGGGQAFTDSSGSYKLYLSPGTYTVEGFTPQYGKLTTRSGVVLNTNSSTTVDFAVSSELATISGTVVKNNASTSDLEVWITVGDSGYSINRTKTGADGTYSLSVPYGSGYYLHIGKPGTGEIYKEALSTFNSSNSATSSVISINTANISVRISPVSAFSQAFIEARNTVDIRKRGFSNKDVSATSSYREYVIEVPRPGSGSLTYLIEGGIPGYGPLAPTSTSVASGDTSKTISLTLGNMWTASGTISDPDASTTGNQAEGAFVWAAGSSGQGGGQVSASGTFSFTLKEGTYDFGIGKKNYSGSIVQSQAMATDTTITGLSLSQAGLNIAGQVTIGGTAESGAWVWASNGSGGWTGDQTNGSGNYTLKVTSGTWTVRARAEGYESSSQSLTISSGTSTLNIALSAVSGYTSVAPTVESITPKSGGIIQGTNIKLDLPAGALSSQDSNTGRVSIQKTTSIPSTNSKKALGNSAYEISAYNSAGTSFTVLNSDITISLTYSASELSGAGLTQAQASQLSLGYWDSTANTWVSVPTNAATTSDGGVIYTGTTNHLSPYAPLVSSGDNPPPTPTGLTATAYHRQVTLSWTASSGATKYDIYRKSGALYPYLGQTTATTYDDSGLTNGTTYYYKISSLNNDNDESIATAEVSATPQAEGGGGTGGGGGISTSNLGDTVPPSISDIKVSAGDTGAAISWKTNEPSISWLLYGTTTAYGSEIKTATSALSHSLNLTNLSVSTAYHYQIKAKDSTGNTASYTDQTFTTLALGEAPKVEEVPQVIVKPVSEMTAEELRTEITRILALISQLQSQLTALQGQAPAGGYEVPSGFTFAKNLSQGMSDPDVVNLKKVLDVEVSDHAAWTGSELFGSKVKAAVVKFQQKYNIGRATGFVGSLTRTKLNQLISK